jgi:hypothetical protein
VGIFGGDSSSPNTNYDYGADGAGGVDSPTTILEVTAGKKSKPDITVTDGGAVQAAEQLTAQAINLSQSPLNEMLQYGLVIAALFFVARYFKLV